MSLLTLRLSGTFDASIESTSLTGFRTAKARALLSYLAMEPDLPHARRSLSTLLWGEYDDRAASANLRNTLANLKKVVAPVPGVLTITRQAVTLHSEFTQVDVIDLARNPTLETIAAYQGDFLADFSFADARPFEEWRLMHQERLHLLALLTLDDLIEREIAAGRERAAIELARRQLVLEPWHERAHYHLIKLLYYQGQRETAVQQYNVCVSLLADELGLAPSPEMDALLSEIEQGKTAPRNLAVVQPIVDLPHNLPRPSSLFVGRDRELDQLVSLLNDSQNVIVTLTGTGGVGKTRLALEAAARLIENNAEGIPDGAFLISLAPLDDSEKIPLAVAEAIGYNVHEEKPLQDQVLDFLAPRASLLIFDNFEHLQKEGHVFLLALTAAAPRCRLLVTSHQKLDVSGETVFELHGLPTGHFDADGVLHDSERLFQLSARRVRGRYDPSPASLASVSRICRLVDGIPLAIELAAAWMDTLTVKEIAAEIERDIDFLASDRRDIPPRQRSMRATFAYSWKLLNEEERIIYAQLSVFRGGFSRQAAQQITGTSIRQLARLVSKSLLLYEPLYNRYAIHELLRQVSEEKLSELSQTAGEGAEKDVRDAHSNYYLKAIAEREPLFRGEEQQSVIRDVAYDFANVRAAWRWGVRHERIKTLSDALEGLFFFFFMSGREQDGVAEFELTLDQLSADSRTHSKLALLRARLKNRIFELTHLYRPADGADVDEMEAIFLYHGAPSERALLMNRRAYLALQSGDVSGAVAHYQRQIPIHQKAQDNFRMMATMTSIAQIMIVAGQVASGVQAAEEALAISRAHGDRLGTALALIILGATDLFWIGHPEAARLRFERAEEIGQTIRAHGQIITGLVLSKAYLAFIHLISGRREQAHAITADARLLWREKNTPFVSGVVSGINAVMALVSGHAAEALEIAGRGLAATNRPGATEFNQIVMATAAATLGEHGRTAATVEGIWQFCVTKQQLPARPILFYLAPAAATILLETGQPDVALTLLTAVRTEGTCPHGWFELLSLVDQLDDRLERELTADQHRAAVVRGRQIGFEHLSPLILEHLAAVQLL